MQVVNFIISNGLIDDSSALIRLTFLHDYLKTTFSLTETPSILKSRLERLHQESDSVAEFSQKFSKHLEELRMSQIGIQMSESYVISTFKSCLNEKYRLFADERVTMVNF